MRRLLSALILLALVVLTGAARAQVEDPARGVPGDGLVWEPVGDFPTDAYDLAFAPDSTLWAVSTSIFRFDPETEQWVEVSEQPAARLLFRSPDTLLILDGNNVHRSTDGGLTWAEVYDGSGAYDLLYEAPAHTPLAGALFTAADNGGCADCGMARSFDGGDTWLAGAVYHTPAPDDNPAWSAVTLGSGRLVQGGLSGVTYSDDAGENFYPSDLWYYAGYGVQTLAVLTDPATEQERVLAVGVDAGEPYNRAWISDDGGQTFFEPWAFSDAPNDGVAFSESSVVVLDESGGGSAVPTPHAVLVLGRGSVYRTDDGGQTWTLLGRAPVSDISEYVDAAVVDASGRLYVGIHFNGSGQAFVYRTAEALPVATEPAPAPEASGVALEVRPNPSSGTAAAVVTLPMPAEVTLSVYDVLGRRVAVLYEGLLSAGEHTFEFDGTAWPTGTYVVRLVAGGAVRAQRVTLLR